MLMGVESLRAVLDVPVNHDPSRRAPPRPVPPARRRPRSTRRTREAVGDVLAHNAVEIGFQPVVDLVSQQPVGFEALARGPAGTELEAPDALFDAARDAGRLDELDWLCQREALRAALRAGIRAPAVLFVNVEADTSGFLPLDLRALYAEATAQMVVAVEVTDGVLTGRPAALLGRVADMRALGCTVALDDVGTAPGSLAMMAVIAPDVVKLDLAELAGRPERELAEVVDAVAAHAERSGTTVLVERIETAAEARLAATLGARLAQGWLFGPREQLVTAPAPPEERQVNAAFHADPRDTTPFQLVAEGREVRRASRELLAGLSRHLEDQARAQGRGAVLVGAFENVTAFDAAAKRRYAELARDLAFCGAVSTDMPAEPADGVHGGRLDAGDPVASEWTVAVVSAHASAALSACGPGADGEYDYVLTHDRALAAAATAALMARIPS
jgi:EAL domain-containing protein (putative c-di-GMP-specific phosphodiesterase class I)